jgi:hypothetical protein
MGQPHESWDDGMLTNPWVLGTIALAVVIIGWVMKAQ